jgi:hypothetical protein
MGNSGTMVNSVFLVGKINGGEKVIGKEFNRMLYKLKNHCTKHLQPVLYNGLNKDKLIYC